MSRDKTGNRQTKQAWKVWYLIGYGKERQRTPRRAWVVARRQVVSEVGNQDWRWGKSVCLRCVSHETLQNRCEIGEQLKAEVWLHEREIGVSSAFHSSWGFGREKFPENSEIAGRVDGLELYRGFVFIVLEGTRREWRRFGAIHKAVE